MKDLFDELLNAKPDALLMVAGLIFLLIAVLGNVAGKIEPGKIGRIVAGALGGVFLLVGLVMHLNHAPSSIVNSGPTPSPTPTHSPGRTPTPVRVRFPATWVVDANGSKGSATLNMTDSMTVEDSFPFSGEFHFVAIPTPQAIFEGQYDGKSKTISFKRLTPYNKLQKYDGSLDASDSNNIALTGEFTEEGTPGTYKWQMRVR